MSQPNRNFLRADVMPQEDLMPLIHKPACQYPSHHPPWPLSDTKVEQCWLHTAACDACCLTWAFCCSPINPQREGCADRRWRLRELGLPK